MMPLMAHSSLSLFMMLSSWASLSSGSCLLLKSYRVLSSSSYGSAGTSFKGSFSSSFSVNTALPHFFQTVLALTQILLTAHSIWLVESTSGPGPDAAKGALHLRLKAFSLYNVPRCLVCTTAYDSERVKHCNACAICSRAHTLCNAFSGQMFGAVKNVKMF